MTPRAARVGVWLAALLAFAVTSSLGVWQLRRAAQKQQAQETLVQRRALPPWGNADWPCHAQASALPTDRPVALRGRWWPAKTVYLDNRPMDGQSGFVVVTPFELVGGTACTPAVLLVQRGWLPRNASDRLALPPAPTPEGVQVLHGRVLNVLQRVYALAPEPAPATTQAGPLVRQNAEPAFWLDWLGHTPLAGAVLEVDAVPSAASAPGSAVALATLGPGLRRHWPEPSSGRERHLGYAAQWFGLAALVATLLVWFQLIRPRRQASHVPH